MVVRRLVIKRHSDVGSPVVFAWYDSVTIPWRVARVCMCREKNLTVPLVSSVGASSSKCFLIAKASAPVSVGGPSLGVIASQDSKYVSCQTCYLVCVRMSRSD